MTNHNNEPAEGLQYFAWKNPEKSNESGQYIQDYQYYEYLKKAPSNGATLSAYHCTVEEYHRLGDRLKIPKKNLVYRELPFEERVPWWIDLKTGERFYEPKFK